MKSNNFWVFEILPSGNYLNSFYGNYSNFSIGEDANAMPLNFLLTSPHFKSKENPKDVFKIGLFITAILNGYTKLIHSDTDKHYVAQLDDLYKNSEKVRENYTTEFDLLKIDEFLTETPKSDKFIDQAFDEGFIRNLLLHCNAGLTVSNVYKIQEETSNFLKERGDDIMNYVSPSDFKAFGATANNFSISGLNARHGKSNNEPPKNTMPIEIVADYIRSILKPVIENHLKLSLNFTEKSKDEFDIETFDF